MIIGLAADERAAGQIHDAAATSGEVTACTRAEELVEWVTNTPNVVAVITELWDADGKPTAPAVRRLRHWRATLPVIAFCRLTPRTAREIVTMAAAGVSAIAIRDHEDLGDLLRSVIDPKLHQRRSASSMARTADASTAGEKRYPWP
ncbi:MAG TPA: hypothetical protein VFA43_19860 [Gemmatimonadaceae bacterium]|nr:hypothetical protein [Gemmatimonadaceae bacterium]